MAGWSKKGGTSGPGLWVGQALSLPRTRAGCIQLDPGTSLVQKEQVEDMPGHGGTLDPQPAH